MASLVSVGPETSRQIVEKQFWGQVSTRTSLLLQQTSTYTITIYYCPVAGDVYLCSTYSTRILSSTVDFWLKQEKHFYADDPHVYIEKISWYFTAV